MVKKVHGGDIYTERELPAGVELVDFSANLNPLGMPQAVKDALCQEIDTYQSYQNPQCRKLRQAIGRYYGIPDSWIVCGNGAADVIWRLVLSRKPRRALLPAPTFSEYAEALECAGCELCYYDLPQKSGFVPDEGFLDAVRPGIDICFFCNPNNPTGVAVESGWIRRLMERCQAAGVLLVLDECFLDFTGQEERSLIQKTTEYKYLFILKSFTKMYAMPGIRLGYGVCGDGALLRKMEAAGQCWGVSVLASEAGIAALGEGEYKEKAITLVREERAYLKKEMEILGMTVWDGQADYLFFRTDGIRDLYDRLLPEGIMIRRCSNYRGLDETCYRVAVKDHEANGRLIEALKKTAR